jgi:hypothetical protein
MEILLIPAILVHVLMVSTCFMVAQDAFKNLEHKRVVYSLIVVLPIVNVIMTLMLMDISLKIYKRSFNEKQGEVDSLNRQLTSEKRKYEDLERRKFRRIKVGNKFHVPNTDDWKEGFRNTECTIIELGNEVIATNELNNTRWSVKWHHLQYMVFLSDEPVKPFEFIK